ncbi:MAG: serine hydrolase [Acidimicrobiia bacterium]
MDGWRASVAAVGTLVVVVLAAAVGAVVVKSAGAAAATAAFTEGPIALPAPSRPASLQERLDDAGYRLPLGTSVYAAEVVRGPTGALRLLEFEAGGGAREKNFWPASSIKVMAAVAALDFLRTLGFTGAATVEWPSGWSTTVRMLVHDAINESANDAYDLLIQIAGFDRLNAVFLSPANGFPDTVIQRGYAGYDIRNSPELVVTEGARTATIPARSSSAQYGCPDAGNCSNLYEMTESIRRIVLHDELPPAQRFNLDPADVRALDYALLASEGWIDPGVARAFGIRARVYNKPGFAGGLDCLDVGLVEDVATGHRFLIGITTPVRTPGDEGCWVLATVAEEVLEVLAT